MQRVKVHPRYDWQTKVVQQGMNFHTINDKIYWDESVCYEFQSNLIDKIENVTKVLHDMCLNYVEYSINNGNYSGYWFENNSVIINLIEQSWKTQHPYLYGRFDLGINSSGDIKMFEYNADTPTALLEASVIQWNWKQDIFPDYDQFNSIHEKLINRWKEINPSSKVYFTAMTNSPHEDWSNIHYMLETFFEAGFNGSSIDLEMVGWDSKNNQFVDMNNYNINYLFKLYPWEWLCQDEYVNNISKSNTVFIEPPWKMLLSNKLLCAKLWEMYPDHENLLRSGLYTNPILLDSKISWIQKPMLGREGQGVKIHDKNNILEQGNIMQEKFNVAKFDGMTPVIGSWIIGDEPAGIGIREDIDITTNNSRFVPHYFVN